MQSVFKSEEKRDAVIASYNRILSTWAVEHEERDLETSYGITHCIVAGSPDLPPLLMFHGVGDNSAVMWVFNMPALAGHFHCIAIDTLGGPGKSIPGEAFWHSFDQVDWIDQLYGRLGLASANLLGVSNGAYMVFNYVVERPSRAARAVCLEGGMVTRPLRSVIRTLGMMFPEILVPTTPNLVRIMRKLSSPDSDLFEKHPEVVEHMILAMRAHNRNAMFRHRLQKYDREKAARVRDKLHFMLGGYRLAEKQDFVDVLVDGGFSYEVIERAGHGSNHEQPEAVNAAVIKALLGGGTRGATLMA